MTESRTKQDILAFDDDPIGAIDHLERDWDLQFA
jgi:hypothetical protein